MKATINIHNLNLFFNAALNVDELLDSVVKRIQNIDLPSPADLTPVLRQAQEPAQEADASTRGATHRQPTSCATSA